ncbi:hypothetical protein [Dasania marina]|uniref:hypothetical protein n=1 Tax=Dasania marina TaxID=471499 RepID=UPI0030DD5F6E|tara:strand:- start:75484 stop:76359 length:876 start_codon:yes stop_codon:yes gene_type:complete
MKSIKSLFLPLLISFTLTNQSYAGFGFEDALSIVDAGAELLADNKEKTTDKNKQKNIVKNKLTKSSLTGGVTEFKVKNVYPGNDRDEACHLLGEEFPNDAGKLKERLGLSPSIYSNEWAFRNVSFYTRTDNNMTEGCKGGFDGYDMQADGQMSWSDSISLLSHRGTTYYLLNKQMHAINGGYQACSEKRASILNKLSKKHSKPTYKKDPSQDSNSKRDSERWTWDYSTTKDAEVGSDDLEMYDIYISCSKNEENSDLSFMHIRTELHSAIALKSGRASHTVSTSRNFDPEI